MGSLGGLSPEGSITIGIIVGLLSTSVQSLGLTLQRKSHILEDEKGPNDVRRPPHRRRRWQIGMGLFIIANLVGSTVQISTLPLPVLSTLQAAGLVFNSICASLLLHEPFTRWSLWGTILVSVGAVLIGIFGAIPSPTHTLKELLELMARWPFILWMALQAVLVVAIAVVTEIVHHLSSAAQKSRGRFLRGLAYGCISGILSAHSLLFAKSAVELVLRTIFDHDNQFIHWQSWMILLGLLSLALSQLYYLHRGLKLVSTSVLYPFVFCIYNIIAILDGLIYFNQTDYITPLSGSLIALGTVILLSGVLALSWRLSDEQHSPAGAGQSTLAPGLGLVEDTDVEEDGSYVDSDLFSEDEDAAPHTYDTFEPATPHRKPSRFRERAEIIGLLDDHEALSPSRHPHRSYTQPSGANETTALLGRRKHSSHAHSGSTSAAGPSDLEAGSTPRKMSKKRRKSTGFPGFTARKHDRRKSTSGGHDGKSGIWKMKWWKGRDRANSSVSATEGASTFDPRQSRLSLFVDLSDDERSDPGPRRGVRRQHRGDDAV